MKALLFTFCLLTSFQFLFAQPANNNVFVITIDGTRWKEVFGGADSVLLSDATFVQDTTLLKLQYWHPDQQERRRRLMPFFWSVIVEKGQLMGNRQYNNKVNVANLYKISYPGYSEIFTGSADKVFIPNLKVNNRRTNILQYLNDQPAFRGKIAAFCSWRVFPFILNEKHSSLVINAGYKSMPDNDPLSRLIDSVQASIFDQSNTRHDLLTFESTKNYMKQHHPRVLYMGLGETDNFAHDGDYDTYLQKIHQADAMIAELWYLVQTDPLYKNNTTFIITTDHGRGRKTTNWTSHGFWVGGSGETWMALLGSGIEPLGELKNEQKVYQKQVAPTIAALLGGQFKANHRVADPIKLKLYEKQNDIMEVVITAPQH